MRQQSLTSSQKLDGVNKDVFVQAKQFLDRSYFSELANLDKTNPKLLVVLSGGNAVGKSTVSRVLGRELNGLVLENDDIRRRLRKRFPDLTPHEINSILWRYSLDLYAELPSRTPNGFIIRDAVIDWHFDTILPIFDRLGYQLFVVGFDVSKDTSIELINARGDTPTVTAEKLLSIIDEHTENITRFRSQYTPDILLTDNNLRDYDSVVIAVKNRLEHLRDIQ